LPQRHKAPKGARKERQRSERSSAAGLCREWFTAIKAEPEVNHWDVPEHDLCLTVIYSIAIILSIELEGIDLTDKMHFVAAAPTHHPGPSAWLNLVGSTTKLCAAPEILQAHGLGPGSGNNFDSVFARNLRGL
jgi:hypothetical protein